MNPATQWKSRRAFQKAQREAAIEGDMVCGTVLHDGTPKYFTMPPRSTDEEVRAMAFAIREGRKMNRMEQAFLHLAEARRA